MLCKSILFLTLITHGNDRIIFEEISIKDTQLPNYVTTPGPFGEDTGGVGVLSLEERNSVACSKCSPQQRPPPREAHRKQTASNSTFYSFTVN